MTSRAVRVVDLNGTLVVDLTPFVTDGEWRHTLDQIGYARVRIENVSDQCCEMLSKIRPWLHQLQIERGGHTVSYGPINKPFVPVVSGRVEIEAYDVAGWFYVRFARYNRDWTPSGVGATDISIIVQELVDMALDIYDPGLLDFIDVATCDREHERKVVASPHPHEIVWDTHLSQIIGSLMHMSVHGRSISFWCINSCLVTFTEGATEADFASLPPFIRDGDRFATSVAVIGNDDPTLIVGISGGPTSQGLLVERAAELDGFRDTSSANAAARALVTPDAPLSTWDSEQTDLVIGCNSWFYANFQKLRPGQCLPLMVGGCVQARVNVQIYFVGESWKGIVDRPVIGVRQKIDIDDTM